jgi:hypothetical protein
MKQNNEIKILVIPEEIKGVVSSTTTGPIEIPPKLQPPPASTSQPSSRQMPARQALLSSSQRI